jgi:hypothetical protein
VSGRCGNDCFLAATQGAGALLSLDAIRLNEAQGVVTHYLAVESERLGEAVMAVQVGASGAQKSGDAMHAGRVRLMKAVRYWTFDIDVYDLGRERRTSGLLAVELAGERGARPVSVRAPSPCS